MDKINWLDQSEVSQAAVLKPLFPFLFFSKTSVCKEIQPWRHTNLCLKSGSLPHSGTCVPDHQVPDFLSIFTPDKCCLHFCDSTNPQHEVGSCHKKTTRRESWQGRHSYLDFFGTPSHGESPQVRLTGFYVSGRWCISGKNSNLLSGRIAPLFIDFA